MTNTSLHLLPGWPHQKPQLGVGQLPRPLTPHPVPFQASACPEPCLADPTQTRYPQHITAGSRGRNHLAQLPHLTVKELEAQRGKAAGPCHPVCLWQSQDTCLPEPAALQGLEERRGDQALKEQQSPGCCRAVGSHPPGGWGLYLCYLILPPPRSELCVQSVLQNVGWYILRMLAQCLAQSRDSMHI